MLTLFRSSRRSSAAAVCKQAPSIWQIRWLNVMVIRRRILAELHSLNVGAPGSERFGRPVHAVHDGSVCRQDNRERQIRGVHQLDVFNQRYPSCRSARARPRFVQLPNPRQWHLSSRVRRRQLHKLVHIPRKESSGTRPKEVLFSHHHSEKGARPVVRLNAGLGCTVRVRGSTRLAPRLLHARPSRAPRQSAREESALGYRIQANHLVPLPRSSCVRP